MVDDTGEFYLKGLGVDASANAVDKGLGLLENLLQHEVWIASFFELCNRKLQLANVDATLVVVVVDDAQGGMTVENGYLAITYIDEVLGVFDNRCSIGGEEKFPLAATRQNGAYYERVFPVSQTDYSR